MNESGVYAIINGKNQKCYIGSSLNITKRVYEHRRTLRLGTHQNSKLQRAWNKYSEEEFMFVVLEVTGRDATILCEREQYYIDTRKPEYNIYPTAYSGNGNPRTEEEKENLRQMYQGRKLSEEHKKNIQDALNRPEVRVKRIGKTHKKFSEESKAKMSEVHKEVQNRPELKEKQRQSHIGKKMPRDAVEKASKTRTGQKRTPEQRERMRQAQLNRTTEAKERVRQGQIKGQIERERKIQEMYERGLFDDSSNPS